MADLKHVRPGDKVAVGRIPIAGPEHILRIETVTRRTVREFTTRDGSRWYTGTGGMVGGGFASCILRIATPADLKIIAKRKQRADWRKE
jgi:hypothetical protein